MINTIKLGVTRYYTTCIYKDRTITPFAHGIGIEVCEKPWILPNSRLRFKSGMVLCVEPNVFIPHVGSLGLEQEVVTTSTGVEVITSCPTVYW